MRGRAGDRERESERRVDRERGGERQFGVRSVKFHHHLVGAGGATGRISFFDVRTWNTVEALGDTLAHTHTHTHTLTPILTHSHTNTLTHTLTRARARTHTHVRTRAVLSPSESVRGSGHPQSRQNVTVPSELVKGSESPRAVIESESI